VTAGDGDQTVSNRDKGEKEKQAVGGMKGTRGLAVAVRAWCGQGQRLVRKGTLDWTGAVVGGKKGYLTCASLF